MQSGQPKLPATVREAWRPGVGVATSPAPVASQITRQHVLTLCSLKMPAVTASPCLFKSLGGMLRSARPFGCLHPHAKHQAESDCESASSTSSSLILPGLLILTGILFVFKEKKKGGGERKTMTCPHLAGHVLVPQVNSVLLLLLLLLLFCCITTRRRQ